MKERNNNSILFLQYQLKTCKEKISVLKRAVHRNNYPDKKSSEKVCHYVRNYQEVYGTVGIHPHDAKAVQKTDYNFIATQLVKEKKIIALGECGYDFHYNRSSYREQKQVFCKQLEIALETDYPVVIHSREAEKETMQTLLPFLKKGLKILFHSFTSSQKLANFGVQFDCYFSFNGIITFSNAISNCLQKNLLLFAITGTIIVKIIPTLS